MAEVRVENLTKKFGNVVALDHVSLTFEDQELTVLVGPSGCGKTTLLRIVAGLEESTEGYVYMGGKEISNVQPWNRNMAMVFQNYALYPHMTVFDNMAFPLRARKMRKEYILKQVQQTAQSLGVDQLLRRKPRELSGGQVQRVAVGRATVRQPEVFLMDEPLSNLDAKLRVEMRAELKRLQKDLGVTTIYVTHDQAEAMTMADKLVVMRDGKIQQEGAPEEVYAKPRNTFVASFIGSPAMNFIKCTYNVERRALEAPSFQYPLPERYGALGHSHQDGVILGVRPEKIRVLLTSGERSVRARVYVSEPLGKENLLTLEVAGTLVKAITAPECRLSIGQDVWLDFDEESVHLFDVDTTEAISVA
jgi:multiple sugar transport system ATP-binding protein